MAEGAGRLAEGADVVVRLLQLIVRVRALCQAAEVQQVFVIFAAGA